ncbi:aldehyde dehydrogenase [Clostridium sp. A1-XYC3]|uniref:Aldehyde dehydrogenase n=1 Tax=Clostridium tanneri TaxID=3037988 RepID=A0ABU4JUI3_9CLOT|nr:aldehyde dehydrogenase [Clostridium sp. A1-XYC3]MDW8801578.1 aldehyde dehydrogenase [Clostridium sp. A1-XYC3]
MEEVLNTLEEQKKYFYEGKTKDIYFRINQLKKLKKGISENEKLIIDALYKDLHKPEFEAYATEIGYLYDSIGHFIKNLGKWARVKTVRTPRVHFGSKSYIYSEPYGSVLIVGPFNYPFQLVIEPLIGAISAGNCVVIKPSEFTTNVSKVVVKLIRENFDERYIKVIEGGKETTAALINSPFDYIFFTGSINVGKIVMEAAAKNLVPVTLELGGKSPTIVHKDANIEIAAQRIVWGKFMNVGQTCVAPDYILVHREVREELISKMIKKIKVFYGNNPKTSRDYGRIVNEKQMSRLIGLIDKNKTVFGGDYDIEDLYIHPTIMDNVKWEDKVMEEEIFGPILPVLTYENLDDVIIKINSRPKPLALYVFTEDKKIEEKTIQGISYGGGCVNDTMTHLASPFLPFGGVGTAGLGSYHGRKSFETFSHIKSVLKKSTKINFKFIFPPYNRGKVALLRKIMK